MQTTLRSLHHLGAFRTNLPTVLSSHLLDSFAILVFSTNALVHFLLAQYTSPSLTIPARARSNEPMDLRIRDERVTERFCTVYRILSAEFSQEKPVGSLRCTGQESRALFYWYVDRTALEWAVRGKSGFESTYCRNGLSTPLILTL